MNVRDYIGPGQHEQIVVALQQGLVITESLPAEVFLFQAVGLDHGPHGAIEYHDAFFEDVFQNLGSRKHEK